jgi:hypothetical protein
MPASASDEIQSPRTPYPGLRPFLDYEDMLLYGRTDQIKSIVHRLGRGAHVVDASAEPDEAALTRFVAVIGGSGSGKSSLIRAGVVPFLRQFGIPEVGDLWRDIVFTPGTNFAVVKGAGAETPITRLARKFEASLAGARSADRVEAIADLLRRPGGLGRMVDVYGAEFDVPASVQARDACALIVIDQFEELFHRSNLLVADARALIERVIDHYHQAKHGEGSKRCFLAITMRSEHLNDCASYIGLPEAINAGAYLVSRLDEDELREVIRRPAQRFLRLRQREQRDDASLPSSVVFDDDLVARLVADTLAIAQDPDHLPLLQHALARVWQCAREREGVAAGGVPQRLTLADLDCPVVAETGAAPVEPNALRASLDRWAQHLWRSQAADEQVRLTELLRHLAYRDPVSGTYNQQRLHVADHALGPAGLHALLAERWIGGVNYLHWDDDDPSRITLKVSHESFIRGWRHFRHAVDEEALRLERFGVMLAACRDWVEAGRNDDHLLDRRSLVGLEDAHVAEALGDVSSGHERDAPPGAWKSLTDALSRRPLGDALSEVSIADTRRYFRESRDRLARENDKDRRYARRVAWLGALAVLTALGALFTFFVLMPVVDRSREFFSAAGRADRATLQYIWPEFGGGAGELDNLIQAAALFEKARTGNGTRFSDISDLMLLDDAAPLGWTSLSNLLPVAARSVEPRVNGTLRATLVRSLWLTSATPPSDPRRIVDAESDPPITSLACDGLTGSLVLAEGSRSQALTRRGVFITQWAAPSAGANAAQGLEHRNRPLYSATLTRTADGAGTCKLGRQIVALPLDQEPAALFDALLSHMLQVTNGNGPDAPATLTVSRLAWESSTGESGAELLPPQTVVLNDDIAKALRRQVQFPNTQGTGFAQGIGMARATWRMPGGRALLVDGQAWRIVSQNAQRIEPMPSSGDLVPLQPAEQDRYCKAVLDAVPKDQGPGSESSGPPPRVYRDGNYCLTIAAISTAPRSDGRVRAEGRRQVFLGAYVRPRPEDLNEQNELGQLPVSIASIEFGNLAGSPDGKDWAWQAGKTGSPYQGWLMLRRAKDAFSPERIVGVPWSTDALRRLAVEVLADHRRNASPAAGPARAASSGASP